MYDNDVDKLATRNMRPHPPLPRALPCHYRRLSYPSSITCFIQGPSSTVRATFRGVSSLLRHASAGTLSSVSGVTNALSRNLGSRGAIAGTMGLVRADLLLSRCWLVRAWRS